VSEENRTVVVADPTAVAQLNQAATQTGHAVALGALGVFATDDRVAVTSFDPRTPEGRQLLQKCEENTDDKVRSLINEELVIRDVYAKVIDYQRPDSDEVIPLLRVCLITTDGKVYGTVADGVRESVLRLMTGHGLPPWKAGVRVKVRQKPTRNERVRLWLEEQFDSPKGRAAK
jgi:hypothetical protein